MGPIAGIWARLMSARGHDVSVVTAYPHYPGAIWGRGRLRPHREVRDGVPVLRLPLWIGHDSAFARIREDATYALSATAAMALLPSPDVYVVVSPSFAALAPVSAIAPLRRRPWVLWLQDILPEAALTTGLVRDSPVVTLARRFERIAYERADRIVVISETFRRNLLDKGVAESKVDVVYNPAVRGLSRGRAATPDQVTVLAMGNIGLSQALAEHVRAFEASDLEARLVILGTGEAAESVRAAIRSRRVEMRGLVDADGLERALDRATVGLLTQRDDVTEFNVPSRLMTFMGRGIPVIASVRASSEVAGILERSGGGWVTSRRSFVGTLEAALADPAELERRGDAARRYASRWFEPESMCARFQQVLEEVVDGRRTPSPAPPER
jgi:colanic acid biosynthesis glycosyl transferase WcaI